MNLSKRVSVRGPEKVCCYESFKGLFQFVTNRHLLMKILLKNALKTSFNKTMAIHPYQTCNKAL